MQTPCCNKHVRPETKQLDLCRHEIPYRHLSKKGLKTKACNAVLSHEIIIKDIILQFRMRKSPRGCEYFCREVGLCSMNSTRQWAKSECLVNLRTWAACVDIINNNTAAASAGVQACVGDVMMSRDWVGGWRGVKEDLISVMWSELVWIFRSCCSLTKRYESKLILILSFEREKHPLL